MAPRFRSFLLPAAAVAYVCFAALGSRGGWVPWAALIGLPLLLGLVWRRTGSPRPGEDHTDRVARSAARAVAWGAALWLAARAGASGRPGLDAVANAGTGVAAVAALVALARIAPIGGLMKEPPATRSLDAAGFTAFLWGVAVTAPATRAIFPEQMVRLDPLTVDYATTTAGVGTLLVLVVATWRLRTLRRLELGASDRAAGALALSLAAFGVAVPAAALDVAPPDRVLPIAVIAASLALTWTATTREPTTVSSSLRAILALLMLGAPTLLIAGFLAKRAPGYAGSIVLFSCVLAVIIGLVARSVAGSLGPEQSRWLDAIDAATRGALQPEPDAAIRASLMALSKAIAAPGARPELWRIDPAEVLSVDVAGYLHVDRADAPSRLYELALSEPERTLRAEVLAALEVRRPDVRPLLAWFQSRRAFSATVVVDEDGPLGFLLLPRGGRTAPMALEEARAVRSLGDRISALLAVSSALARSRDRELVAIARADKSDDELQRLEHIIALEAGRNQARAERDARRVQRTCYSPPARVALDRIEQLGRGNAAIALLAPPGVDACGWAAAAHLASPRRGGPFVVVECGAGAEHDPSRWQDTERSPLALADGGTLVLLDAAALPAEIQELVARTLSRKASGPRRSSILPAGLIASLGSPIGELVDGGRLSRGLASWIGDSVVELPALADRAEDLRALILEQVARAGLAKDGKPVGLADSALRLLTEHDWPGNEIELADVIGRAVRAAHGEQLGAEDLAVIGFSPLVRPDPTATPTPFATRRRLRARPVPRRR